MINALDSSFDQRLPAIFETAIVTILARCNVSAVVYRPDAMQLDGEGKLHARLADFKADSVLNMR